MGETAEVESQEWRWGVRRYMESVAKRGEDAVARW